MQKKCSSLDTISKGRSIQPSPYTPCLFTFRFTTGFPLDGPGIESRWGEIFRLSRPALGLTQPPLQWVPGVKYGCGALLTTHHLLVPLSCKSRAIPLPTLWATIRPVTGTLYILLGFPPSGFFVQFFNMFTFISPISHITLHVLLQMAKAFNLSAQSSSNKQLKITIRVPLL